MLSIHFRILMHFNMSLLIGLIIALAVYKIRLMAGGELSPRQS
jgi:hypothetical protein